MAPLPGFKPQAPLFLVQEGQTFSIFLRFQDSLFRNIHVLCKVASKTKHSIYADILVLVSKVLVVAI